MQLHAPRDDRERDDSERLQKILAAWGTRPIDEGRITRRGRTSQVALDVMTVPGGEAWSWRTRSAWHSGLSYHAICSAWRSAERHATRQVCSPAALRRLPPEAWNDLRCRYSYLGYSFGVRSDWDLPPEAGNRTGCAPAETLPEGHPAMAGLLDDVNGRCRLSAQGPTSWFTLRSSTPGLRGMEGPSYRPPLRAGGGRGPVNVPFLWGLTQSLQRAGALAVLWSQWGSFGYGCKA